MKKYKLWAKKYNSYSTTLESKKTSLKIVKVILFFSSINNYHCNANVT